MSNMVKILYDGILKEENLCSTTPSKSCGFVVSFVCLIEIYRLRAHDVIVTEENLNIKFQRFSKVPKTERNKRKCTTLKVLKI